MPKTLKGYISPGHSASRPGATGINPEIKEHDLNRLAALVLEEELMRAGIEVTIHDPDPDSLAAVGRAAKGYDFAYDLHHNAHDLKEHYTAVYLPHNAKPESVALATKITAAIAKVLEIPDGGVRYEEFQVPKLFVDVCNGPSGLVEFYFCDACLNQAIAYSRTAKAAKAMADTIVQHFSSHECAKTPA